MSAFGNTGAYDSGISRTTAGGVLADAITAPGFTAQVIQELPAASALLSLATTVPMSSLTNRQPVLSVLPEAFWLNTGSTPGGGDYAVKKTSRQAWENVNLYAEELAVIIPIPLAYLSDSQIDVWEQVRPRVVEAIARKLDAAGLFGVEKPQTWGTDIYSAAVTAGNQVTLVTQSGASGPDIPQGIANAGVMLSKQGYVPDGICLAPGTLWDLAAYRTGQGLPIYAPSQAAPGNPVSVSGFPTRAMEVQNGSFDPTKATALVGSFKRTAVVGVRQDITFTVHTDGVIQDPSDGSIVLNLMQQDSIALRAVFRVGYAVANPVTQLTSAKSRATVTYWPFAVVNPAPELS